MNDGSVDQATSVIYNADIRPKIKELVSAGESVLSLLDNLLCEKQGARSKELGAVPASSTTTPRQGGCDSRSDPSPNAHDLSSDPLDLIEKMEGIAYRAIRDSISFQWYSITGKHATWDDVEFWMPKSIAEFDVDQMIKDMAATPECLHFIHNTFLEYLQRVPWREEINYWLGYFSVGEAGEYKLRHALNQEKENPTGKALIL